MRTLRRWWYRKILRWDGELCQRCGRCYYTTIWWADDALWQKVAWNRWRLLCPTCFGEIARQEGLWVTWKPEAEPLP